MRPVHCLLVRFTQTGLHPRLTTNVTKISSATPVPKILSTEEKMKHLPLLRYENTWKVSNQLATLLLQDIYRKVGGGLAM